MTAAGGLSAIRPETGVFFSSAAPTTMGAAVDPCPAADVPGATVRLATSRSL